MKLYPILIIAAALAVPMASQAHERGNCNASTDRGRCKIPPPPPAPPPLPAIDAVTPPMPPMPPLPPPPPEVPDSAHAACAGKAVGTALTLSPKKGITMKGSCQRDSKGMYFDVEHISDKS